MIESVWCTLEPENQYHIGLFQKLMAPPKEDFFFILLKKLRTPRLQIASEKIGRAKMREKKGEFPEDPKEDK